MAGSLKALMHINESARDLEGNASMRRTRHSEPEIRRLLREAESVLRDGGTIPQVCQKLGISEATFHRWRKRYTQDEAPEVERPLRRSGKEDWARRVKELEKENKRLKQLVGQLVLDNAFLKDAIEARHRK
jgi:transposase-like protein